MPEPARLLAAVALGLALGAFSALGDPVPVKLINGLANAASPWILTAFLAGMLQPTTRRAALGGALALVAAVAVYYVGFLLDGHAFLLPFLAAWSALAMATGGLFGLAGHVARDRQHRWRTAAVALAGGALLAEAAYRLILLEFWTGIEWQRTYTQVAVADTFAAVLLVVLLVERGRWLRAISWLPPVAAAGLLALLAADGLFRWVVSIGDRLT